MEGGGGGGSGACGWFIEAARIVTHVTVFQHFLSASSQVCSGFVYKKGKKVKILMISGQILE